MQGRGLLILLLVLTYSVGAFARALPSQIADKVTSPELNAALQAYRLGQYNVAYQQFYKLGNAGNAEAQFYVGYLHDEFHLGMTQNYTTALHWYRLAAEQGHPKAQFRLGYAYEHGRGVTQDTAEAARWYQAAAGQGDAEAQAALGRVGEVQGLDQAIAAYERGDHPRAFTLLTDLANERDMKAREATAEAARRRGERVDRPRRDAAYVENSWLRPGTGSVCFMSGAMESRKTTRPLPSGMRLQRSPGTPMPRSISRCSMSRATVSRRIRKRPGTGTVLPKCAATRAPWPRFSAFVPNARAV